MDGVRVDIPFQGSTYAWEALERMTAWADDEALVTDTRRYTYGEFRQGVLDMAAALWHHGIRPTQTIGAFAHNPAESLFMQMGAHLFGARTAWAATTEPMAFRNDFLRLAGINAFVYDARSAAAEPGSELARLAAPLPIFCFGRGSGADLTLVPHATSLPFDPTDVRDEPWTLVQTGGTTGHAKLVRHRHRFFATLLAFAGHYRTSDAPKLRHLLQSGTWHISSQTAAFMTLFSGGTLFLKEGLDNKPFLQLIERERINSAFVAPPGLYQLIQDDLIDEVDLGSLLTLTVSGSAAAPARLAAAAEKLGPVVRIVYGMSECPMIAAMPNVAPDAEHPERLASCGLPFGDARIEIRDDNGDPVPTGEPGAIWVSSSMNMDGYFGAPEATAEAIVDGWLRTGDVGRLDSDGYLYVVDRDKDMIITGIGSSNVFCRPVEDLLLAHPSIAAAALIGVPDSDFGERVHAYVVAADGRPPTVEEIRGFVRERLNERWTPTSVEFIASMPYTAAAKVDKKALRALWAATHTPTV